MMTCMAAAAALPIVGGLAGCSTATPVLVEAGKLPALSGRVNTTAGYTGTITTETGACRGSFTGILGQEIATVEMSCSNGRTGIGTAVIREGRFVSAEVRLNDGSLLTVRPNGPSIP